MNKIVFLIIMLHSAFAVNNASGQFQQIQSESVENFNDVFFLDKDQGYIAGDNGTMLITYNGGYNWVHLPAFTSRDLLKVWFINHKRGFAAGVHGAFFVTDNGGLDWQPVALKVDADFNNLLFVGEKTGYATGNSKNGSIILKTSDGGILWTEIKLSSLLFGQSDKENIKGKMFVNSVSFINDSTGLFGGYYLTAAMDKRPFVCKTTDGAQSFSLIGNLSGRNAMYDIVAIDFKTENDAFFLKSIPTDNASLFASNYRVDDVYQVTRTDYLNHSESYFGLQFIDRFIGYVTARINGNTRILKTIDNGETFIRLNPPTQETLNGIAFTDSQTGIFVGGAGTILLFHDGNNPVHHLSSENSFSEPAFSVAIPFLSNGQTNIYVYNVNVSNDQDVTVSMFDNEGNQLKIVKSKTRFFNREIRMKLKLEDFITGMYYYVIKVNEDPVVNGKISAIL